MQEVGNSAAKIAIYLGKPAYLLSAVSTGLHHVKQRRLCGRGTDLIASRACGAISRSEGDAEIRYAA